MSHPLRPESPELVPKSETEQHSFETPRFAVAREHGYTCGAMEVGLPHCGYRADVAAYNPARETRLIELEGREIRQSQAVIGTTAVFECKQARADLLKDSCNAAKTRKLLKELNERRMVLERLLKVHLPSTANGDSLFQEFQSYNLEAAGHKGYHALLRRISILQKGLFAKNKFEKMMRYRCASVFYLVTTCEILTDYEVPLQWGLLVEECEGLTLKRKPVRQEASEDARLSVLQRIAVAGTKPVERGGGQFAGPDSK